MNVPPREEPAQQQSQNPEDAIPGPDQKGRQLRVKKLINSPDRYSAHGDKTGIVVNKSVCMPQF